MDRFSQLDIMIFSSKSATGFHNDPFPSWTLISRLGEMLQKAEAEFGPRDLRWTVLGVEFSTEGPMVWFPGNTMHVAIMLSLNAANDADQAIYELAQEIVHLLAPCARRKASNLEEGIATIFAEKMLSFYGIKTPIDDPAYVTAVSLVRKISVGKSGWIKSARALRPDFYDMDANFLIEQTQCDRIVADELCSNFPGRTTP